MSDVDLIISVHTNGAKDIANLSASLRTMALNLRGITVPMKALDQHSKNLNKAIGLTSRGMNDHAKSIKQVIQNQKTFSTETRRIRSDILSYRTAINSVGGSHTQLGREMINTQRGMKALGSSMKGIRFRAFSSDMASVSLKMQRMGKDAQFVGRSLMINLTAPIVLLGRLGLKSFISINRESVKLSKILEQVAMSTDQARLKIGLLEGQVATLAQTKQMDIMVAKFKAMDNTLTTLSNTFGVSKDLVIGLAADFAELGVTSEQNITSLVEMTTTIEKLGNMDIGGAKDLAQALYFNSKRAFQASGALDKYATTADKEAKAIRAATTQMQMFNAIENVTALSLADLAEALPELGSMAVSFGLSLNEAAALIAPMKAAGLDIGASATSVKVSLQRAIVPTHKNVELLKRLSKQYGVTADAQDAFTSTSRTGLTGLQAIVKVYDAVNQGGKNTEGALKLMSQLFEKRQGPRMILAIEQLSQFNKALSETSGSATSSERLMSGVAEASLQSFNKLNGTSLPATIENFKDIGVLARIATGFAGQMVDGFKGAGKGGSITAKEIEGAQQARKAVADLVKEKRQAEGIDLIGQASTESGKVMLVELAGASTAAQIASQELQVALSSTAVAQDRIKNAFKLFAADMISLVGPAINKIADKITALYEKWQKLSDETKNRVRKFVVGILAFLAVMGPLVIAMGTFQASVGVLGRGLTRFLPKLKNTEGGFIGLAKSAGLAKSKINSLYSSFIGKTGAVGSPFSPAAGAASTNLKGVPKRFGSSIGSASPITGATLSRVPGRGAFGMGAATAEQVAQYGRNEADMLAKSKMAITSTGRLQKITPSGGRSFVSSAVQTAKYDAMSKASVLRENLMSEKDVLTSPTGQRMIRTRGGVADLSERQAKSVARGGISGRVTKVGAELRSAGSNFVKLPSNIASGYTKSILGAKAALAQLQIQQMAVGGNVGMFTKMKTAVMAFTSSTNFGTKALKLMKIAMISSGIGIALLTIAVVVILVKKNWQKFSETASGSIKRLKAVFNVFKDAVMEIIRPIVDLFANFGDGSQGVEGAIGGISTAFGKLVTVIEFVGNLFAKIVKDYIQPYMYMIINLVAFVVEFFQGHWGKAFDYLIAAVSFAAKILLKVFALAFSSVVKVVGFAVGLIVKVFGAMLKVLVNIVFLGVKVIITLFTLVPKAFAKATGFLSKVPGLGFLKGISDGVNGVVDSTFALVDKAKSSVNGGIDSAVNGLVKFVNSGDEAINKIANNMAKSLEAGTKKGIKQSTGKLKLGGPDMAKAGGDVGTDTGEAIAENMTDGFDSAGGASKIGKKIKDELMDAAQKLQDYIAGELTNAIKKYVDESVKALNAQKDSALKVFDIQLSTLTKLEKAEESLTKTKAYEAAKRKLIDDKALSDEQFRRNFAVAVYEGRIDDARMLQLDQQKIEKDQTEELKTIESDRAKDLAKENLDALKEAINEAKDAASKFFDESISKFQEAVALLTKFPPVTIEDYRKQIGEIMAITQKTATDNGVAFGEMFDKFVTTINDKMPNKVVGAFTENLDALVAEAKLKYGLGGASGENTIIGVTLGMLAEMGGTFGDGKQAVIDQFGLVSTGIVDNFVVAKTEILRIINEDFLVPFTAAGLTFATNWQTIYTQAIKDGNQSIIDSYRNMLTINKELQKEMLGLISAETNAYILKKVAIDAANEAANNSGGGGGSGNTNTAPGGLTGAAYLASRTDIYGNSGFGFNDASKLGVARGNYGNRFRTDIKGRKSFAIGGLIPQDQNGFIQPGYINAPETMGVPALLHGGEFIINAKAASRIGLGALTKLNNNLIPRFKKGGSVPKIKGITKSGGSAAGESSSSLAQSIANGTQFINGPYGTMIPVLKSSTINLNNQPIVQNNIKGEGGLSTIRSASFTFDDGKSILVPTVVNGKIVGDREALNYALKNNKHLGVYPNEAAAILAASVMHLSEESRIAKIDDAKKQLSLATAAQGKINGQNIDREYDWKKDKSLNVVEKAIFSGSGALTGIGKFISGAVTGISNNATRAGMSLYNVVGAVSDMAPAAIYGSGQSGRSLNPLKNLMTRQNDLYYGRGIAPFGQTIVAPGMPTASMAFAKDGPYSSMPLWKKSLAVLADPAISDAIGIASVGSGTLLKSVASQGVNKVAMSGVGELGINLLTKGQAAPIQGAISQFAANAAQARLVSVLQNKNLLGKIQSGTFGANEGAIKPTSIDMPFYNRALERNYGIDIAGIKDTYGKTPMQLVADVISGRSSAPSAGYAVRPSIGAAPFIDTTAVDTAASSVNSIIREVGTRPSGINFDQLTKISEGIGSHPGGIYKDFAKGTSFYIKTPTSATVSSSDLIQNELLADALYREAGLATANLRTISNGSQISLISDMLNQTPDLNTFSEQFASGSFKAKIQKGFAIDAWLGNYDVIGLDTPNILNTPNGPVRIDVGGSMFYSGTGKLKSSAPSKYGQFGNTVDDLEMMRSNYATGSYSTASRIFSSMDAAQLTDSAKLLEAISPDRIIDIVKSKIPQGDKAAEYARILIERRKFILNQLLYRSKNITPEIAVPQESNPLIETIDSNAAPLSDLKPYTEENLQMMINLGKKASLNPFAGMGVRESIKTKYGNIFSLINKRFFSKHEYGSYSIDEVNNNRVNAGLLPMPKNPTEFDSFSTIYKSYQDKYGNPIIPTKPFYDPINPVFGKAKLKLGDIFEKLKISKPNVENPFMAKIFNAAQRKELDQLTFEGMNYSQQVHDRLLQEGINLSYGALQTANSSFSLLRLAAEYESKLGYIGKYSKALLRIKYPSQVFSDEIFEKIFKDANSRVPYTNNPSDDTFKKQFPLFSIKEGRGINIKDKTYTGFASNVRFQGKYGNPIFESFDKILQNPSSQYYIPHELLNAVLYPSPIFTSGDNGVFANLSHSIPSSDNVMPMMKALLNGDNKAGSEIRQMFFARLDGLIPVGSGSLMKTVEDYLGFAALRSTFPENIIPNAEAMQVSNIFGEFTRAMSNNVNSLSGADATYAYETMGNDFLKIYLNYVKERFTGQIMEGGIDLSEPNINTLIDQSFMRPGGFSDLTPTFNENLKTFANTRNIDLFHSLIPAANESYFPAFDAKQMLANVSKKFTSEHMNFQFVDRSNPFSGMLINGTEAGSSSGGQINYNSDPFANISGFHEELIAHYGANYGSKAIISHMQEFIPAFTEIPKFLGDNGLINEFENKTWTGIMSNDPTGTGKSLFQALMKYRMRRRIPLSGFNPEYFSMATQDQVEAMLNSGTSYLEQVWKEYTSNATESKSLPFYMAYNGDGIIQSIMEMLGVNNPSGVMTSNVGDIIGISDIFDTENISFPLKVKEKMEYLPAYNDLYQKLLPGDVGIHTSWYPGLSKIVPPATINENVNSATADSISDLGYRPVSSYPLLKGAAYTHAFGKLYQHRPVEFLKTILRLKDQGLEYAINPMFDLDNNQASSNDHLKLMDGKVLNSTNLNYYPDLYRSRLDAPSLLKAMFGTEHLEIPNKKGVTYYKETFRNIFEGLSAGYLVHTGDSAIPDPEGWLGSSMVSNHPNVIMRWQTAKNDNSPVIEDVRNKIFEFLITPKTNMKDDYSNIMPTFVDRVVKDISEERIKSFDIRENPIYSKIINPESINELQANLAMNKNALMYLQEIMNSINPNIKFFGGSIINDITGKIPGFKTGGYVPGKPSVGMPAILHGGEYVINSSAVNNMGRAALESINNSRFRAPSSAPSMAMSGQQSSVSTVNINVDTFIGEEEWFKTMMKDYNINILPKNQRNAGNESRTFSSYNGVNKGY